MDVAYKVSLFYLESIIIIHTSSIIIHFAKLLYYTLIYRTTKEMETYPVSVIERSLTASPRNAWLYYTAARIVLSPRHFQSKTNPKDNTHLAVQWLGECVMSFYKRDCPLVTNPLFLYR